ncbi:hypothetical protein FNV62_06445 [Streptomyces sp. RLB3-17]|uniref:hypothetical protein n=1 Tax=unclassified Streptomyces TaxID=2593676 RepID=UPI001161E2B7|nr:MULTISPECIES: hypothetical protein [unclassified Streptomyces]QDN75869.1 hypothetical protein FNV64_10015 [Streptomyces sp. S1A1-7]QDN85524.1 hypothetical protein FNV61_07635 [Streptomyces sp. RLB3-6]QDO06370.1 hypothetical protein FNV68_09045 [Streptomyces sp. S1D4-23]QDO37869.1 hypothetical protein FNV62_06445 [Streptomyces sp. RLB3-17]
MDLFDKNQDAATEPLPAVRRDVCALTLAWYMAGRASEPAGLNIREVAEDVAELVGPETGELLELPALVITLHRSKTNPHGRTTDVVRIVAQDDKTCPLAAWRQWRQVLAAAGVERGPLLRRVKNDKLTTAGRPPRDPARAGGIGDRTIRNLIRDTAAAAGLTRELTAAERRLLSTAAEAEDLAALDDAAEREALAAERRRQQRLLRQSLRRYSGHSMRRGQVRHQQRLGVPRHIIETTNRYRPGSKALSRYLDGLVSWQDNPTVLMRQQGRAAPPGGRAPCDRPHAESGREGLRG